MRAGRDDILRPVIVNTTSHAPTPAPYSLSLRDRAGVRGSREWLSILLVLGTLTPLAVRADSPLHASSARLQFWQDAKLGLFIHWGPWSQSENGLIWSIETTKDPAQRARWLDLYKTFNPAKFDPDEWAKTAGDAGMKYVVFTTQHHDGFCNFDTALSDYRITAPDCPYSKSPRPDVTAEIVRAFRARKMKVGLYYSLIDWHHPDGAWHHNTAIDETFVRAHPDRWRAFAAHQAGQVRELLTHYGPIDILWFDVGWPKDAAPDARSMLRDVRTLQPDILVNDRGTLDFADFVTPEQGIPNPVPPGPWETCITISEGNGFWYKGPDAKYKSTPALIRILAEVVSRGGNLLLNIGPRSDGSFPPEETERLKELGQWLGTNCEAIYGTSRSPLADVPAWGRVTRKGSSLYLIVLDPPKSGSPLHLALPQKVTGAHLLTDARPLHVQSTPGAIDVVLPPATDDLPRVVRIEVE